MHLYSFITNTSNITNKAKVFSTSICKPVPFHKTDILSDWVLSLSHRGEFNLKSAGTVEKVSTSVSWPGRELEVQVRVGEGMLF